MTIAGAFLGSGVELVPAGSCLLKLQVVTSDRQSMGGAVFSVTASGFSQSATADASGRAEITVPSGATYTVGLTHSAGSYFNDEAQTVIAESATTKFVYFDLINDESSAVYHNLTASVWTTDTTYEEFPFRCGIAIQGVTSDDYAEVVFSLAQSVSGEYAPICETYSGGIYIYSENNTTITIPTIFIRRA